MPTTIVYILFAVLSTLVFAKRPWISGLGLASAAWFIYFPDAIFQSDMPRSENLVLSAVSLATAVFIFLKSKKIKISWRNWWVRLVCYTILVMLLPWVLFGKISLYHAVLYPSVFLLIFSVAGCIKKWQAIFWSITWLIGFNILTNYVGVPGWPWEAPRMYLEGSKNVIFNLNIAYEAIWLSLLMGISLLLAYLKSKQRLLLFMFSLLYFIITWTMHWSRALTLSCGVLVSCSPLAMAQIGNIRRRVATSVAIFFLVGGGYFLFAPQVLTNIFWIDETTQARVEEKLVREIVSDNIRVRLFKATFNLWQGSPIWGVGLFRSGEIILGKEGEGPHSGLLMLLAEGGLLAGIIFMFGVRDLLTRTKPWVHPWNPGEGELRSLVFLGIVSLLPRMMFDGVFYNTPMLPILVITGYRIIELTQPPRPAPAKYIRERKYVG